MIRRLRINEDLESSGVYNYPAIGILNSTVEYVFYEHNPDYDYDKAHELPFDERPRSLRKITKTYRLDRNKAYNNISEILEDLHTINPNIPVNIKEYDDTIVQPEVGDNMYMYRSRVYVDDSTHKCIVYWCNVTTYERDYLYIPIYLLPRYLTNKEFYKFNLNE